MKNRKIYGVVVLYNPNISETINNINSYVSELDKLYIIDNSEKENYTRLENYITINKNIEYTWLGENKGIAKALNVGKNKAINEEADYFLTIDQDSSFKNNFREMINWLINNELLLEKVAIISPIHNLKEKNIKTKNKLEEKEIVMTSGNILNLNLIKNIGDFNEDFFIDEVDHEFCYRIREKGYKILCLNDIELNHKLGNLKNYKFFSVTNHNYIRRYYITRNRLYMIKRFPELKKKYIIKNFSDFFKIILFEKNKIKKIKYFFKGIDDFYKNKKGKLVEGV
ncbi:rhamnosyltransferase [Fusobacterium necrogenes]|uniref:Rhamnosyltransferase n=1 Tax=Fusobacterium necrogenes TaxID=858 RepID=A0A377GZ45_9FUSO|nr:glycosyltransferase family 2 protein [Fusobacterium necrogenes]STO32267.1 rhamnosyltransferase [Fusobacterium necrogenes]